MTKEDGYYFFKMWNILSKDGKNTYGAFGSRRVAIEYLNMKKEQHFFETGNMEEAEQKWGVDNFRFEENMMLDRGTTMRKFAPDLNTWNYDI